MIEEARQGATEAAESILELPTYDHMSSALQSLSLHSSPALQDVVSELKTLLILQPERIYTHHTNLTTDRLRLVRDIFKTENTLDPAYFEVHSGYLLMAVTEGFLLQSPSPERMNKIKQFFARRIQKSSGLWGLEELESLQAYLIDKSTGYVPNPSPIHHQREVDRFTYFLGFYEEFGYVFPQLTDVHSILFKMALCLREEAERDRPLLSRIRQKYLGHRYHLQTTTKNLKFVLEFFKHSFNEKESRYYPQKAFQTLLTPYSATDIEQMLTKTSIGMDWQQFEVYEYFLNCIKLGFSDTSKKMMVAMIKFCENYGRLSELSYCFENNIKRVFIFMKFPKFYANCMEVLKHFVFSPPPALSFFEKLLPEITIFIGKVPSDLKCSFLHFLQVVAHLYRDTAPLDELNKIITENIETEANRLSEEQLKGIVGEYSWNERIGSKKSLVLSPAAANKPKSQYKGLTNIGNSCYMNSFLQALFMNREFLRLIIKSSTLEIRAEKLKDKKLEGKERQFIEKEIQDCVKPFAELQKIFALLMKSIRNDVSPLAIRQVAPEMFRNSSQHDTIEFGREFLELIFRNNIPAMFEGEVTTQIVCRECSQARYRKEAFLDYHVSAEEGDLQDLLRSSFSEEIVKDLTCDHCGKKGEESVKNHFISKFPNYLLLSIHRFHYDIAEKRNKKNKAKVAISPLLVIDNIAYQVYSIIVHTGPSPNAGHYFTFSKTALESNSKWVCHNDSYVSEFQNFAEVTNFLDNSLEDTPYIIFYQNVEYIEKNREALSQPIILREPQDKFVRKDNEAFLGSQKKTAFQLQPINFNFFMKKEDDEDNNGPGNGGFYNSYVA